MDYRTFERGHRPATRTRRTLSGSTAAPFFSCLVVTLVLIFVEVPLLGQMEKVYIRSLLGLILGAIP
jgi:hypothetical protein